ncbi:hypothetical protein QYE76_039841 [Lolium multiflorum]|uniref:RNase H type-1 domain-containing protein n=1 Tax=Lolium multiflorum TaxID=4521 RepID=A0AAD8WUW3_LOLMU|nr:hypothetical protein QYE76_039841 [Lolium multiflorum]
MLLGNQEIKIGLLKEFVATKKANAAVIKWEKDLALPMTDTTVMNADTRAWYNEQRELMFKERAVAATSTTVPDPPPATGSTSAATEVDAPSTAKRSYSHLNFPMVMFVFVVGDVVMLVIGVTGVTGGDMVVFGFVIGDMMMLVTGMNDGVMVVFVFVVGNAVMLRGRRDRLYHVTGGVMLVFVFVVGDVVMTLTGVNSSATVVTFFVVGDVPMLVMGEELFTRDPSLNADDLISLTQEKVTMAMNDDLCKDFTDEEIGDALFQIGPLKAPGNMPDGVNDTAIILIPKNDQPETLKDFRPISLCTVIYKLLKAKYYPNGSLLDTVFTGNGSSTWHAIEYGLELIKQGAIWRVGNGAQIRAWRDPWIPRDSCHLPRSPQGRCQYRWVADFLLPDGAWNMTRLTLYFQQDDIDEIVKIKTSSRNDCDFIAWHPEKRGSFTVRSAYRLALHASMQRQDRGASSSRPDGARPSWNIVWKCQYPNTDVAKGKMVIDSTKGFKRMKEPANNMQGSKPAWLPPKPGEAKLNVDGAFTQDGAGIGMVLRDHQGHVIFTACRSITYCRDATEAELTAIEEGLRLALLWTSLNFTIETDCAEAAELIKGSSPNMSVYAFKISVIRELLQERDVSIAKISRGINAVSHELAKLSRVSARTEFWLRDIPQEVATAVAVDCNLAQS